jgi:hypothetical protein
MKKRYIFAIANNGYTTYVHVLRTKRGFFAANGTSLEASNLSWKRFNSKTAGLVLEGALIAYYATIKSTVAPFLSRDARFNLTGLNFLANIPARRGVISSVLA